MNYDAQLAEIQRRQKLAELLQQQSVQPLDNYGNAAPISNLSGLAKILQGLGSKYVGGKADRQMADVTNSAQTDAANSAHDMFFQPSQGSPVPSDLQSGDVQGVAVTPQKMGGIAPTDPNQQLASALAGQGSTNPYTRQMSSALLPGIMAGQNKAADPFTLGQNDVRFSGSGQEIARGAGPQPTPNQPFNPDGSPNAAFQQYEKDKAAPKPYQPMTAQELKDKVAVIEAGAKARADAAAPDPEVSGQVADAIAHYKLAPLSSFAMARPAGQAVMAEVAKINPQYNAQNFTKSQQAYKAFGTGKQGDTVRSMNVAIAHLDTMGELTDALQNGNVQAINAVANRVKQEFGSTAPTSFDAAKAIVGDEIIKAIVGSGGALSDRQNAQNQISSAKSPAQLKQVIDTYQRLMAGQLTGLKQQYEQATMRDDFNSLLSDKTISKLENSAPSPGQPGAPSVPMRTYNPATGKLE